MPVGFSNRQFGGLVVAIAPGTWAVDPTKNRVRIDDDDDSMMMMMLMMMTTTMMMMMMKMMLMMMMIPTTMMTVMHSTSEKGVTNVR